MLETHHNDLLLHDETSFFRPLYHRVGQAATSATSIPRPTMLVPSGVEEHDCITTRLVLLAWNDRNAAPTIQQGRVANGYAQSSKRKILLEIIDSVFEVLNEDDGNVEASSHLAATKPPLV